MPLATSSTRLVKWLAYASGASVRRAHSASVMRVLMLHGVGHREFPADVLDRQLAWLKRNFEVLSLAEIVERLRAGEQPSGREVALTFDDGLRNNATVVAPLLAHHELPATFFICPGLIDDEAWIWNVEARERLDAMRPAALEELHEAFGLEPRDDASEADAVEHIVEWMKALPLAEREDAEAGIRDATAAWAPTDEQRLANDMMSWDEVAALDPERITIGSHTVHHPTLTTLSDEDLRYEVVESRALLEERTGRPVAHFCYPSGIEDDRVRSAAADTYEAAVTVEAGIVAAEPDLLRLPRIGVPPSPARLAWRLNRP